MKLKKLPTTAASLLPDGSDFQPSPEQEAEWLRHKHFGAVHQETLGQKALMGLGGKGRKLKDRLPDGVQKDLEEFWAQMIPNGDNEKRMLKGGHGVPLSGQSPVSWPVMCTDCRLHERSVLCSDHHWYSSTGVQGRPGHWIIQPLGSRSWLFIDRLLREFPLN